MKRMILGAMSVFIALTMVCTPALAANGDYEDDTTTTTKAETTTLPRLTPTLTVSAYSANKKSVKPGQKFTVTYTVTNKSKELAVQNISLKLSGGDSFTLSNSTDTTYIESIAASSSVTLTSNFNCIKEATAGNHSISAAISYEYIDNYEKCQGSSENNMTIEVAKVTQTTTKKNAKKAALTPQVLVSSFTYGGKTVTGGQTFNLSYVLKNNSDSKSVKNVVIKLAGGDTFVVADGTDTSSVKSINKKSSVKMSKSFQVQKAAASGVYPITATVTYEYYDGTEKQQGTAELTMSVPVVQPDKVQIQSIGLQDQNVTVGQESDCSFQIINSGQTKLSNSTISLKDEDDKTLATAFLGNIEAGTQFTSNYNLPVTFDEEGQKNLTLVFEYENEDMKKIDVEQSFSLTAKEEENPFDEMEDVSAESEEPTKAFPVWGYALIGVGALAVIIAVAVIIKKHRKKKKALKDGVIADEEI